MLKKIKRLIRKIISRRGFVLFRKDEQYIIDGLFYSKYLCDAKYSPWLGDQEFLNVHNKIKDYTLVDIYKCYELWQLVEKVNEIKKGVAIIEIGVWRGGSAGIIAKKLSILNSNNKLYLADTFTGVVKASDKDFFYKGGEHKDTTKDIVENLLNETINYKNYEILTGIFPEETSINIPNKESFGLCHIDVDVYDSAKGIVEWIWDKMIIGGMIVFDDYGFESCTGIPKYVEELRSNPNCILIHNLNGHAIIIKIK